MIGDDNIFLIDTNILVYAYAEKHEQKSAAALELLKKCWKNKAVYSISSQNLAEFSFIATKKYKINSDTIKEILSDIMEFNGFVKINYSEKTVVNALNLAKEFNIPFWDSLLIATMKENKIFNIYTENTDDFKVPWINAVSPFGKV